MLLGIPSDNGSLNASCQRQIAAGIFPLAHTAADSKTRGVD